MWLVNFILGTIYSREHGAPKDDALAFKYFDDGARKGDARSMHRLEMSFEGRGTPQENKLQCNGTEKRLILDWQMHSALWKLYATGRGRTTG